MRTVLVKNQCTTMRIKICCTRFIRYVMPPRIFRMSPLSLAAVIILITSSFAFFSNMIYLSKTTTKRVVFKNVPHTTAIIRNHNYTQGKTKTKQLIHNLIQKQLETHAPEQVNDNELQSHVLHKVTQTNGAIMTMFTSFRYSEKKLVIHKNTMRNWSLLRPYVIPVLFADKDELNDDLYQFALSHGWSIATIPKRSPGGLPVLRYMYLEAERLFNTTLYCFANSDILFNEGLIRTLESAILPYKPQLQGLMLVGKRTNVHMDLTKEIKWFDEVTELAKNGSLFGENAQDYFITLRGGFPWGKIPDFVIGRNGYDNWLVAKAMKERITTIDATNTILAFHQSGDDGDFAWKQQESEKTINIDIGGAKIFYKIGHNNCTPFLTKYCSKAENSTEKTGSVKDFKESCPSTIILAKRLIDHCYRLRRKLSFKRSHLIDFKQRVPL